MDVAREGYISGPYLALETRGGADVSFPRPLINARMRTLGKIRLACETSRNVTLSRRRNSQIQQDSPPRRHCLQSRHHETGPRPLPCMPMVTIERHGRFSGSTYVCLPWEEGSEQPNLILLPASHFTSCVTIYGWATAPLPPPCPPPPR